MLLKIITFLLLLIFLSFYYCKEKLNSINKKEINIEFNLSDNKKANKNQTYGIITTRSGLILREKPSSKSKKILLMSFANYVKVNLQK